MQSRLLALWELPSWQSSWASRQQTPSCTSLQSILMWPVQVGWGGFVSKACRPGVAGGYMRLVVLLMTCRLCMWVLMHLLLPPWMRSAVGAAAQHGAAHRVAAPRQLSASVATESLLLGGISSFAFQGTNAHAIIGKQLGADGAALFALPGPSAAFLEAAAVQRSRYWVLPAPHPLISSGSISGSGKAGAAAARSLVFECRLLAPRLALYGDHQVFGRVLFPGAGMLEAALEAGATALDVSSSSGGVLAVSGMAISSPIVIPQPNKQQQPGQDGIVMRCSLDPASGAFQVSHAERPNSKTSVQSATGSLALAAATAASVAVHTAAAAAVKALAVRRALLGKVLATVAAAAGHATGRIAADSRLATDGFLVPPACMDACLHLGVAAPGCGAKVPVAVGAFALVDRRGASAAAAGGELAGSTSAAHAVPAGASNTSSFALCTAAGGAFASLADLQTKVSKSKAGSSGQTAAAASVKPADLLYEVDWEAASHPVAVGAASGPGSQAALAFGGSTAALNLAVGAHSAAAAALSLVQQAQAVQAQAVAATLPEVLPAGSTAPNSAGSKLLAAGALEGLLRVAATEHAAAGYSLTAADGLAAAGTAAPEAKQAERGILSTMRVHGGVAAMPRLLPRWE
jgi:hypothetical protein